MDKHELMNGLQNRYKHVPDGFLDQLRGHLTRDVLSRPPAVEPYVPQIKIVLTLTPGSGGYALNIEGTPEDGVQADTIIDACLRAARYFEALQRKHELRQLLQEMRSDPTGGNHV